MGKRKIMLVLALDDFDHCVENDAPARNSEPAERKKWGREDWKARAVIGLSLSNENVEQCRDVKSAKHMWNAIKNVLELHTLRKKLAASRKLYTVTMENGEKMLSYINYVKQLE